MWQCTASAAAGWQSCIIHPCANDRVIEGVACVGSEEGEESRGTSLTLNELSLSCGVCFAINGFDLLDKVHTPFSLTTFPLSTRLH